MTKNMASDYFTVVKNIIELSLSNGFLPWWRNKKDSQLSAPLLKIQDSLFIPGGGNVTFYKTFYNCNLNPGVRKLGVIHSLL
jgi:hypothetical protein